MASPDYWMLNAPMALASALGITMPQAIGIVANLAYETDGFTAWHERGLPDALGGIGAEMATGPRRIAFQRFIDQRGVGRDDYSANIDFIVAELRSSEAATLAALRKCATAREATKVYMALDERPGVPALDRRLAWADRLSAGGGVEATPSPVSLLALIPVLWRNRTMLTKIAPAASAFIQVLVAIAAFLSALGVAHIDTSALLGVAAAAAGVSHAANATKS